MPFAVQPIFRRTPALVCLLGGKMRKNKLTVAFIIFIIVLFSSCGSQSVAMLFSWVKTIDHNAEYFKVDKYGNTAEKKFDENEIDFENDLYSISSSIFCIGEKFKYEFPNKMHEIKGDPYGVSLSIGNKSSDIDYIILQNVSLFFNDKKIDLLDNMVYSDNHEKINYDISIYKEFNEMSSEFSSIKRSQLKEFLDTKKFSFTQKQGDSLQKDYVIKELAISLPQVNFNKVKNVKLYYEIEICTKDGTVWLNTQEVNYVLKEETVKLK